MMIIVMKRNISLFMKRTVNKKGGEDDGKCCWKKWSEKSSARHISPFYECETFQPLIVMKFVHLNFMVPSHIKNFRDEGGERENEWEGDRTRESGWTKWKWKEDGTQIKAWSDLFEKTAKNHAEFLWLKYYHLFLERHQEWCYQEINGRMYVWASPIMMWCGSFHLWMIRRRVVYNFRRESEFQMNLIHSSPGMLSSSLLAAHGLLAKLLTDSSYRLLTDWFLLLLFEYLSGRGKLYVVCFTMWDNEK